MKSPEPSTETSKSSRGEASTTAHASSAMPAAEDNFVNLTVVVDPSSGADDVNHTVAPPLSFHAMMEYFMAT